MGVLEKGLKVPLPSMPHGQFIFSRRIGTGCVSTAAEMDIYKAIRELHAEKVKLDRVIAVLEEMQNRGDSMRLGAGRRRERKSMKAKDREQVPPSTAGE
jgi:hypothetical protein